MDYDPNLRTTSSAPIQSVDEYALKQDLIEAEEEKKRKQLEAQQQAAVMQQEEQAAVEQQAAQQQLDQAGNPLELGNVGQNIQNAFEVPTAVAGGLIDFTDDTVELVGKLAGQDWEFIPDDWGPQNKTPWGKALRSIVSFIGPTIGLGSLTRAGLMGLTRAAAIGKVSKAADLVGRLGVDMAAGTAVDVINRNTEGDNLIRTLKDHLGDSIGWLPDDWATLDTDSPDIKKKKNILEGAGLGLLGSIIEGGVAWARALKGVNPGVEFIPKDDVAKKGFQEITNKSPVTKSEHPFVDRILKDDEYASKHIDEMAEVELKQYGGDINNVDQFSPNIHSQVADESESLPRVVRPDGMAQAMVDNARIIGNVDTVDGRMSNFFTDSAIKAMGFDDIEGRTLIKAIEKSIRALGNFEAKLPNGRMMTHKELLAAGDNLAASILDPTLDGKALHRLFDRFDLRDTKEIAPGVKSHPITDTARVGAERALNELKSLYLNMDTARASAYFQASQAGDVADMATASRVIGGDVDVTEIQQRVMEKMEALWYEVEMNKSIAGWALNNQKTFGQLVKNNDSKAIEKFSKAAKVEFKSGVRTRAEGHAAFLDQILQINKSNPEFVKPLMRAYELTNGDVNSIHKLNKYMNSVLGVVNKAFIDGEPQIPSQVVQGLFGTFYNLKLSSLITPIKALSNNFALLLMKPANVFLGAAMRGDSQTMHRAWVQYATHMDTTFKASADYMGQMFRKVAADPSYTQRADFVTQNKEVIQVAREYAAAEAAQGRYGPQMKVNFVEMMEKINNHPWVRYSMNFMESGDAFVKAAVGMSEARGRAYDELLKNGEKITAKAIDEASNKIYRQMFDDDGLITDAAVKYASGEIAMNLDNELANGLNNMLAKAPLLKTLVMFPRTSINVLDFINKHSPLSYFMGDLHKIRTLKDADEIAEYLTTKGIQYSDQTWKTFKAEVEGRVAMGTMLVGMGGWMYAQNNLTGNGNYDKQLTKFQQNAGDKPLRSWRSPIDGKWYSYDGIEPIATFLALTADILDNVDTLGSTNTEKLLQKAGFALSMNLTNKSFLQGLQPLTDLMSGQPASFSRWLSNSANVSLFTQMARIINPGLREVDNDLQTMLRNKWNILDTIGIGQPLPHKYDFIDGSIVGREDPLSNVFNNLLPFKTSANPSDVKQFLLESEFDVQPSLKKSLKGVNYDVFQRSRLAQIMGETGYFRNGLEVLMNDKRIQEDLKEIRQLRRAGVTSDQADLADSYTHTRIRQLLNKSVRHAQAQLAKEIPDVRLAELKALKTQQAQKSRNATTVLTLQNK